VAVFSLFDTSISLLMCSYFIKFYRGLQLPEKGVKNQGENRSEKRGEKGGEKPTKNNLKSSP